MADPDALAAAITAALTQAIPAILNQWQQQQQAAQQAAQAAQAPQAPAPQFARTPAQAQANLLDLTDSTGAKIYKAAKQELKTEFSLENPNVKVLLEELQTKETEFGWERIFQVNVGTAAAPDVRSLLTNHGQIKLEQVRNHALTFIDAQTRDSQNDFHLFLTLQSSVDEKTLKVLANEKEEYLVGNGPTQCGILFLKCLLNKAEADTRATTSHIRTNLTLLDTYMREVAKNNIIEFNEHVRDQVSKLSSRGESSSDLLVNLFKGYLACGDKDFVDFIKLKKNDYEQGTVDISTELLMTMAENKYKSRVQTNEWLEVTAEEEKLIALQARLDAVQSQKDRKPKPKPRSTERTTKYKSNKPRRSGGKRSFTGDQAWRNTAPKKGEPHTKTVNGQTWQYCTHHGYWGQHSSKDCRMHLAGDDSKPKVLDLQASMAAVGVEDIDMSSSDSDSQAEGDLEESDQ